MFIKIEFEKSSIVKNNGWSYMESYLDFVKNKNIPQEFRSNIFTKEQVDKLNNILDCELQVEQINIFCLSQETIYKNVPYVWSNSSEDDKLKAQQYEDNYNNSEFLDLYTISTNNRYIVDSELLFTVLDSFNIKYKYQVLGTIKDLPSYTHSSEIKILEKLLSLEEKLNLFSQAQQFNTTVGVHISDLGLLNVKEVDILYDACTDELQKWLNEGWRILSICPQPDQRRPDYILGRNERTVDRKRREKTCD